MNRVALFRAAHRGAEGAGVRIAWQKVSGVRDLAGAMDTIAADGDGWMYRLRDGARRSVWALVGTEPVELRPPAFLTYGDTPLRDGRVDWIDGFYAASAWALAHIVDGVAVRDPERAVAVMLPVAEGAWRRCGGAGSLPEQGLALAQRWLRGEASDAQIDTMRVRLWAAVNGITTDTDEGFGRQQAVATVAGLLSARSNPQFAVHMVGSAERADRNYCRVHPRAKPFAFGDMIRTRLTPEALFDDLRGVQAWLKGLIH